MTDHDLENLLAEMESDRVERKAAASDRDKIRQAICAFANDLPNHKLPGVIFVGVNDNGSCSNLPITDELLRTLADMRSDGNILPFPAMTVQKRLLAGCEIAAVIVEPADAPPVRYNGRVWVRVGPRRATATAEEERRLSEKRRAKDQPFDLRPVNTANLDDLDLELFRRVYLPSAVSFDVLDQNQRSIEDQLKSLRFVTAELQPTVLGLLTIGKEPRQFLPGAYIQFLRIDGTELTDPIKSQKEVGGALPDLLRQLDELFEVHISVASDFTSQSIEKRSPDYPLVALQQLARNAVLHRSYEGTNAPVRITWFSDRIEIQNPGGPFGQVTRQNFGQPGVTDYRNPHLAEVLKNLGYVQRFGFGIQIARQQMAKNGNPPIEFEVEDSYTVARIKR
ncbi:MAG TPA: ATP-binding protein [Blastocatellia bacterium]|nr:ATP-binding protein [Blastocatellia bacterium]HMV84048.1 ATP-binding protein [Blastocatellia bacterium]HMZ20333.1 ATP-binding protein [Blastocatellia bacterium]HNG33741.1 ATP-binding protein [Blastocatellia bacterium]